MLTRLSPNILSIRYIKNSHCQKHLESLTKDLITKETELKELQKRIAQQTTQNAEYATLYNQEYEHLTQSVYYYMAYPTAEIDPYITSKISEIEHLLAETETLFEVLNQLKSLTDELNTLTKDTQNCEQQSQKYFQQLQNLQLSVAWLNLWQTDIAQFQKQVVTAKTDWETHSACLEKYKKRLAELTQERTELSSSAQGLQQELTELTERITKEQIQLQKMKEERNNL